MKRWPVLRLLLLTLALALALGCGGGDDADDDPPPVDGAGATDAPGADPVFADGVRTYELTVAASDWDYLNANPALEAYVPATLRFEGQEWPNIGVRELAAPDAVLLVEWPEKGGAELPRADLELGLAHAGLRRDLEAVALSASGAAVLARLPGAPTR